MVTDYSGVQFDFAYMKKPLVYFLPSQLPAHYDDGGFFYDTMGFGEICTESDQLVDLLCEYMENGCKMKPKYVERVEDFYQFDDHNNCERIYNEIIKYQQQVNKDKLKQYLSGQFFADRFCFANTPQTQYTFIVFCTYVQILYILFKNYLFFS